jgi:hypothetical protein
MLQDEIAHFNQVPFGLESTGNFRQQLVLQL